MLDRTSQAIDIPEFFLFGEPPQTVGEHYLHLEALSDRSRPNNWNIRTHSHAGLSHVFHITKGSGAMTAEDDRCDFEAPCVLLVPAGVVHGFHFAPDTEGTVLTISDHYLQELTLRERSFAALFVAPAAAALRKTGMDVSLKNLAQELAWIASAHGAAVEAHLLCILVDCARALERAHDREEIRPRAQATMVARFREAIERHYRNELPLARYTAMLGVTERQLRAACLRIAGLPPTHMIQKRILLEAKRALLYSNMTVGEAAYYLGFNDPAYFSRFFTRATGKSPPRLPQSDCLLSGQPFMTEVKSVGLPTSVAHA